MAALFKKLQKNETVLLIITIMAWQFLFAFIALAYVVPNDAPMGRGVSGPLTIYNVVSTKKVVITAYSSTPDQTDSTPCITANGFDLCKHNTEDVIAANFLPFGTRVRIPEYFGDRIFSVQDRMNKRYYYRADIWMRERQSAIQFGAKYTEIEIVEEVKK